MLSGRVLVDLRKVEPDRARHRVTVLATLPDGVRVDVVVGSLGANLDVVRLLTEQTDRLDIDILGEPYAVETWIKYIRDPDVLVAPYG